MRKTCEIYIKIITLWRVCPHKHAKWFVLLYHCTSASYDPPVCIMTNCRQYIIKLPTLQVQTADSLRSNCRQFRAFHRIKHLQAQGKTPSSAGGYAFKRRDKHFLAFSRLTAQDNHLPKIPLQSATREVLNEYEAITKRIRNECETKTTANLVKQRFLTGEVAFIASVRRLLCKGLTRRSRQGPVIHLTARSLTILKSDIRLRGVGYPSSSTWISDSADSDS